MGLENFHEKSWKKCRCFQDFHENCKPLVLLKFPGPGQLHRLFFFCVVKVSHIFPANGAWKFSWKSWKIYIFFQLFHENFQASTYFWDLLGQADYTEKKSLCSWGLSNFPSSRGLKIFMKNSWKKCKGFQDFHENCKPLLLLRFPGQDQLHRLFFFCVVEVSIFFPAHGTSKFVI